MLAFVRDGDTVVVHSMDRLARNLDDLRALVRTVSPGGAGAVHEGAAHVYGRRHGDGDAAAVGDGRVRGVRAVPVRERQREGIALARKRGVYRGRARALNPEQLAQLRQRAADGSPRATLAREFGISRETVYQYLRATT